MSITLNCIHCGPKSKAPDGSESLGGIMSEDQGKEIARRAKIIKDAYDHERLARYIALFSMEYNIECTGPHGTTASLYFINEIYKAVRENKKDAENYRKILDVVESTIGQSLMHEVNEIMKGQ